MSEKVDSVDHHPALVARRLPPLLRFLLPSLVGIALFLLPVTIDGKSTILLGYVTDLIKLPLQPHAIAIISSVVTLAALGGGYYLLARPDWKESHPSLHAFCYVEPIWFCLRLLAAIFAVMVYFQVGSEVVWGANTGHITFEVSGPSVLYILFMACFLMPFLTDFGFMEFVGTLVRRPFALLFRLPGRAAIDATASFVSASMVGMMISIKQYRNGFYSAREASVIATNFSIVSIPFCLVVAKVTGIDHLFFSWYGVVVLACLTATVITARLPPLSRIDDSYYQDRAPAKPPESKNGSLLKEAYAAGLARAVAAGTPVEIARDAWYSAIGLMANVLGPSMAIATSSLILVHHTDIFTWLSYPIYLVVDFTGLPHAQIAAIGFLAGFLDLFTPALLAANLESELTRFVAAGLAVSQIIYMSDLGVLVLRSGLPLNLLRLFWIFSLRTIIIYPIFLVAAHLIL